MQDAKHLPELVAQIHGHAHDDDRSYPSAGLNESLRLCLQFLAVKAGVFRVERCVPVVARPGVL